MRMSFITKAFSGLFGGDRPSVSAPPPVPKMSDAQLAAEEENRKRANAGRASTILTGAEDEQAKAKRVLLGAGGG